MRDARILYYAREEAFKIVNEDPHLTLPKNQLMNTMLEIFWKDKLDLARVG
jgi:hypothetical protein